MVSIWFFIALGVALAAVFLLGHGYAPHPVSAAKGEDMIHDQNVHSGGAGPQP
jgi:hypothetical protein